MFLNRLSKMINEIYIITDADPFGLEIVCTYAFGSRSWSHQNHLLSCPNIRWIGIRCCDFQKIPKGKFHH